MKVRVRVKILILSINKGALCIKIGVLRDFWSQWGFEIKVEGAFW